MKTLKELINRLTIAQNFKERYPTFDTHDGKIHVLFLSPCLHEAGYYRMILPALELNRTNSHSAIINQINKWSFDKQFDDYDSPINFKLVEWADYVVLPAMFTDVGYIIRDMRKVNDDIEFVMDIDLNYHELPAHHPNKERIEGGKDILIKNLSQVDILTAPNQSILNYYKNLIQKSNEEFLLHFESYPNLLSTFTFEERKEILKNSGAKVRIGILLESSQAGDLRTIEKPLTSLLEKYKEQIELIIFGWSLKLGEQHGLLKGLPVIYHKPETFLSYHLALNDSQFDIGLIPLDDNVYNASGNAISRFFDYSSGMIPMVTSNIPPFKRIVAEGENGFIASNEEEWVNKIERLITDAALRREMGKTAFAMAMENFSYTPKTIQRLKTIFV
jgi:glycosyltransferase involved in cell wall biosynthesis